MAGCGSVQAAGKMNMSSILNSIIYSSVKLSKKLKLQSLRFQVSHSLAGSEGMFCSASHALLPRAGST